MLRCQSLWAQCWSLRLSIRLMKQSVPYFLSKELNTSSIHACQTKEVPSDQVNLPEQEAFEQVNIYVNPDDVALRLSSFLTRYPRIGAAQQEDFKEGELARWRKEGLVHFIRVEGAAGSDSHSYFRNNPAVLSDIVLALRTRAFPGGTLRPLEEDPDLIWRLQPNYPLERLPDLTLEPPG